MISFSGDLGIMVTTWTEAEQKDKIEEAIELIIARLTGNRLQIGPEKTEAAILAEW